LQTIVKEGKVKLIGIDKLALLNLHWKEISKRALRSLCMLYKKGSVVVVTNVILSDDNSSYDFLKWEEGVQGEFEELF